MTRSETSLVVVVSDARDPSPVGSVVLSEGPLAGENAFGFSTKYRDEETDQGDWGLRTYMPEMGRWSSRDPLAEFAASGKELLAMSIGTGRNNWGHNEYGYGPNAVSGFDILGLYSIWYEEELRQGSVEKKDNVTKRKVFNPGGEPGGRFFLPRMPTVPGGAISLYLQVWADTDPSWRGKYYAQSCAGLSYGNYIQKSSDSDADCVTVKITWTVNRSPSAGKDGDGKPMTGSCAAGAGASQTRRTGKSKDEYISGCISLSDGKPHKVAVVGVRCEMTAEPVSPHHKSMFINAVYNATVTACSHP